jgi:hypothetical protein
MLTTKVTENFCTKLTRSIMGGIWGAVCGTLKPAGQWLMNGWDRIHDKNPNNRGRLPVIVDMAAISVILGLSVTGLGTPIVYFFAAGETLLALHGAYRGCKIGWNNGVTKMLSEIPEELWVIERNSGNQSEKAVVVRPQGNRLVETTKGVVKGIFAGSIMPYVQIMHSILSAKRPLPMFIISGFLNFFALYTGATVFVGPALSLKIFLGLEAALASYGGIKGGYIGYTEDASHVFHRLWQGGFTRPATPSTVKIEVLEPVPLTQKRDLAVVVASSVTISLPPVITLAPLSEVTNAGAAPSQRLTSSAGSNDLLSSSKLPSCAWMYPLRKNANPKPFMVSHGKIDRTRQSAPRIIRAKSLT